jgi:hypothetical protein
MDREKPETGRQSAEMRDELWLRIDRLERLVRWLAMCGRYRRTTSEDELARRYHISIPPQRDLPISWNIAPTQDVLAIRFNPESKQRTLDTLRWGLIPNWAKDPKIAYKTINARAETLDTAPVIPTGVQETPLLDSRGWLLRMEKSSGRQNPVLD